MACMREAFHVAIVWYALAQFVRRLSAVRVVLISSMTRQEMVWYRGSQCVADRLQACNDPPVALRISLAAIAIRTVGVEKCFSLALKAKL